MDDFEVTGYLAELEAWLTSDAAPENCMQLSELDGFLTGIAAGPEAIAADEFLPVVWGGAAPVFVDDADRARVEAMIVRRLGEVGVALKDDTLSPIVWALDEDTDDSKDWALGFMQAVDLRADVWDQLLLHKKDSGLIAPIVLVSMDEEERLAAGEGPVDPELMAEANEVLPQSAVAVYDFWRERELKGTPRVVGATVGRNDACSCGSGKKYKKCCGG